jgi:8-oxo-dGTP diphosphatase
VAGERTLTPGAPTIVLAVGAIVTDDERILLVQRGHPPSQGSWSIPGGRVELGETLPQALRREILEECGLEIAVGDPAIALTRITRNTDGSVRSHYVIFDFWATPASGPAPTVLRASSDASDIGWFTLDQTRRLPTTSNLVEYLAEALRRRKERIPGCLVVGD